MSLQKIGEYAFLLGVFVAIVAGIIATFMATTIAGAQSWILLLLVVLGIIIGFLNIKDKEITAFLIAVIALVVGSAAFNALNSIQVFELGSMIGAIIAYIGVFVTPAAVILALKAVWNLARQAA